MFASDTSRARFSDRCPNLAALSRSSANPAEPAEPLPALSADLRERIRSVAVEACRAAGALLREDLYRAEGPRFKSSSKALADEEAEGVIRDHLERSFPLHGVIGEELAERDRDMRGEGEEEGLWWLIDPNDGTSSYIKGFRGSAVSLALMHRRRPIFGVVYAFAYPDDHGDLIAGGEPTLFGPITRDGVPQTPPAAPAALSEALLSVSQNADQLPFGNQRLSPSGRYMTRPSVAYRVALAAVGDVEAGVSLVGAGDWDVAAADALLRGAGRTLYISGGEVYRYCIGHGRERGPGAYLFGGDDGVAATISRLHWGSIFHDPKQDLSRPYALLKPRRELRARRSRLLLPRAQGALVGLLACVSQDTAAAAVALARCVVMDEGYSEERAEELSGRLAGARLETGVGLLGRAAVLGLWGVTRGAGVAAAAARRDAELCGASERVAAAEACACLVGSLARGEDPSAAAREARAALEGAPDAVLSAALTALLSLDSFAEGEAPGEEELARAVEEARAAGGEEAAGLCGALCGARWGLRALPRAWWRAVETRREGRELWRWGVDALLAAEGLLCVGERRS